MTRSERFCMLAVGVAFACFGVVACRSFTEVRPGEVRIELCEQGAAFLRGITGHDGVTLPLPGLAVELLPPRPSPELLCHEGIHAEQRDRLGAPAFVKAYAVGMVTRGYSGNPLEVEARERCQEKATTP